MIKLFPCKTNSRTILVYCSVVPRDFPPHHRLNYVKALSKHFAVIFIDLPAGFRLSPFLGAFKFYSSIVSTFFRFKNSFVWEFFPNRRLHFLILYLYLLSQKILFKKKILLYTTSGYAGPVYCYIPYDKSIFDCPDIHKGEFEKNKNWISKFDLVLANTELVAQRVNKFNDNVIKVASGYRNFRKTSFLQPKIPNSVLFLGGISQRINYTLLEKVIQKIPDVDFYFVGEIYLNKYYKEKKDKNRLKSWQRILKYSNVHYLGEFPDELIDSFSPFFKVGIIPYETSDIFNYYSNPIKLFDYLASGMFVISTPLANLTSYTHSFPVDLAVSANEFVGKIRLALSKTDNDFKKYEVKIKRLLKNQSLESKTSQVIKEVNLLLNRETVR